MEPSPAPKPPAGAPGLVWPLRLFAGACIAVPLLLFAHITWRDYQALQQQTAERIRTNLDILEEHTLKALQTVERAIAETNEVLRGSSDADIRARESELFLRFKRTQQALPQIESIWAFDGAGRPLVSSTVFPVPALDNSDRSYFRAHLSAGQSLFVSEVIRARVGSLRFFVVSGRRNPESDGFSGVIGVTVMPEHFYEFYRKLTRGRDSYSLVRADGAYLARYPAQEADVPHAPTPTGDRTERSFDGTEYQIGSRQVSGFPLYVRTGVETAAVREAFWASVLTNLAIGTPAVLAMVGLVLFGLRRVQQFQEEVVRRELAERALKHAQRLEALGQLTGGVAHDFNNLLMIIAGGARRVRRAIPSEQLPPHSVDAIETAVERGAALTRQLLSFARRQTHERTVLDLRERLPALHHMLRSSLRGNITIVLEVDPDLWPICVDDGELELALLNVAVNARDAMPSGGQLSITARNVRLLGAPHVANLEGEFVALALTDTGTGISPDVVHRVFEPFFTTKDIGKGTGLGLSQVYGFAKQADGTATIESSLGVGTTVTLYLPRSMATVLSSKPGNTHIGASARGGRVLLVEDQSEVAQVTMGYLEECGYTAMHAPHAAAGLRALQSGEAFDLVVSDILMPGGADGLDLARSIRRGWRVPILLVTGYSDRAQAARDEGFVVLRKPYRIDELREAIATAQKRVGSP